MAKVATPKTIYVTRQIENVLPSRVDGLIAKERKFNRNFVSAKKFPESDGEFTILFIYKQPQAGS